MGYGTVHAGLHGRPVALVGCVVLLVDTRLGGAMAVSPGSAGQPRQVTGRPR